MRVNGGQLFSVRSGRVIAIGRAVLALFLAASFLLGPAQPWTSARTVGVLLAVYMAWSVAILLVSRSPVFVYRLLRAPFVLPAVDLGVFTAVLYLTSGADSPFFNPFVFLILGATIQWGSRGAAIMGLLTLAAFAPAGWSVAIGHDQGADAAQIYVLRLGYTAVVTVMLMAFGRHVERVVEELSRLSDPLAGEDRGAGPPIRECLRHALWVFGAERGLFLWEEADEPYAALATYADGRFATRDLPPGEDDWVAPEVAEAVFLFHPASGAVLARQGRRIVAGPSAPLAAPLMTEVPFERALVIPAATPGFTGWILVFDHEEPANEDLAIGAMVSAQVSVALERWESERARRDAAAAEDRVRLARDLHDGVLQFLAGAGLQLDGLTKGVALPPEAAARVATLRQAISDEQKELRGFISTLRPTRSDGAVPRRALASELQQLAERLSRYWTIDVAAEVAPADLNVADRVSYDLARIVREAVANAVRHGGARKVQVSARADGDRLSVRIDDDGRGFAFEGEVVADQLDGAGEAPRSLHERVRAMQGRLELKSSAKGATVLINIPLGAA